MNLAPYTAFGKTKDIPIKIMLPNGKTTDEGEWDDTLWIERYEDYYALMSPQYKGKRVRIIEREVWLNAE